MAATSAIPFCYVWATQLTSVATNVSLVLATRHEFAAVTLAIPGTGHSFKSAVVEITCRDVNTAAGDIDAYRIGIKLGAVAFSDEDVTVSTVDSAEHEPFVCRRDVTGYFTTNWSGTSMTAQVAFAMATQNISNINNITAKLLVSYTCTDTDTTRVKTVAIPIMSGTGLLTDSHVEIGTSGNNAASANQIPQLSTFLPEASVSIQQAWMEIESNEEVAGGTTDFNMFIQIDSETEVTRATIESALGTSCVYKDIWIYDTATYLTTAAHAFKLRSSTTARHRWAYAVLYVTYTYDESNTTTVLNSVRLPLDSQRSMRFLRGTATAAASSFPFRLHVGEPGTITLKQSGVVIRWQNTTSGGNNPTLWAGGQAERTYTGPAGEVASGEFPLCHRTDHGTSPWSLAQGLNTLYLRAYASSNAGTNIARINGGFAIINYTSGKASGGTDKHNLSCSYFICGWGSGTANADTEIATGTQRFPHLPTRYRVSGFWIHHLIRDVSAEFGSMSLQLLSGELGYQGWVTRWWYGAIDGEVAYATLTNDYTDDFRLFDQDTSTKPVVTGSRTVLRWLSTASSAAGIDAMYWVTAHSCTYTVSGTVRGYTGDGSGITVDIWNTSEKIQIASATTSAGGGYTATVYDQTTHFAVARQSSSLIGRSDNVTPT